MSNTLDLVKRGKELAYVYKTTYPSDNLAAVFDIDGTLLADGGGDRINRPVVELYLLCKQLGYTLFIVTARDSYGITPTVEQLHELGITGFHSIYFRTPTAWNIEKFKESSRKSIADKGYSVVFSIGDSYWDVGAYGGHSLLIQ